MSVMNQADGACGNDREKRRTEAGGTRGKRRRPAVSIRSLGALLLVAAVVSTTFTLFETQRTASHMHALFQLEQNRKQCDLAIQQFMDGSDYLTMQVQQFVVTGDRRHMDSYWREVNVTRSRDNALMAILCSDITPEEREAAEAGKAGSDALIFGEIWAMRMRAESIGIAEADMPQEVAACKLSHQDAALSAEQKSEAASAFVFGQDYSLSKDEIRSNVNAFRNGLANRYAAEAVSALELAERTTAWMSAGLIVLFLFLLSTVLFFTRLVVSPIIAFSHELTRYGSGRPVLLKETGVLEIRQFAAAFNALSDQARRNTKRLERLGYIDYLTDVPNRASITEYVAALIEDKKQPLGLMIVDIDNFKHFNDSYGHAMGDSVLREVARAVCSVQPAESGIAGRLCGEEFIIAMQNADEESLKKTAEQALQNVREITGDDLVLPDAHGVVVTVSIGGAIWRGEQPMDFIRLLSMADQALYVSKATGKDRYTFHTA